MKIIYCLGHFFGILWRGAFFFAIVGDIVCYVVVAIFFYVVGALFCYTVRTFASVRLFYFVISVSHGHSSSGRFTYWKPELSPL